MDYERSKRFYLMGLIPLGVVALVYLIPVIFIGVDPLRTAIFYYKAVDGGKAVFMRGDIVPLNFVSHAISLFYLVVLIYVSTMRFHGKHRRDGMVLIICVAIIFTHMIGSPVFSEFRYAYALFCCLPFLAIAAFWKGNKTTGNQ